MTAQPRTSDFLTGMMNLLDGFDKPYATDISSRLDQIKSVFEANNYYLAPGTPGLVVYVTAVQDILALEQNLTSSERSQMEEWGDANKVE